MRGSAGRGQLRGRSVRSGGSVRWDGCGMRGCCRGSGARTEEGGPACGLWVLLAAAGGCGAVCPEDPGQGAGRGWCPPARASVGAHPLLGGSAGRCCARLGERSLPCTLAPPQPFSAAVPTSVLVGLGVAVLGPHQHLFAILCWKCCCSWSNWFILGQDDEIRVWR